MQHQQMESAKKADRGKDLALQKNKDKHQDKDKDKGEDGISTQGLDASAVVACGKDLALQVLQETAQPPARQ